MSASDSVPGKTNTAAGAVTDIVIGGVGGAAAAGIGGTISKKAVSPELAEKLLDEWYRTNIKTRVVLTGDQYATHRSHVHTGLFQCLQQAYKAMQSHVLGCVYVVYAKPATGKTHNAAYLLDRIAAKKPMCRGILIKGGKNREVAFDLAVAQELDVPEGCRFKFHWIQTLLEALSGRLKDTTTSSALSSGSGCFKHATSMVAGALLCQEGDTTEDKTSDEIPENKLGQYQPLLFLDDWDTDHPQELKFLKELAQQASRLRVMVVVLTDSESIAQTLTQQNAFQRIKPLMRAYDEPQGGLNLGEKIRWKGFAWTRKELTELVLKHYDFSKFHPSPMDSQGYLTFIHDGMTPVKALYAAREYNAGIVAQNVSNMS